MFLSLLKVDLDIAPGRLWLRNLYRVHQRLCMAFPSSARKEGDPPFLEPFRPDDFQHVHGPRTEEQAFLFRIDPLPGGNAAIVMQSGMKPDWDYAFNNAGYLLAAPPQLKTYEPQFQNQQLLRFRLLANPTRKIDTKTRQDGTKSNGKRVPVDKANLDEWLIRHAEKSGFTVEQLLNVQTGYVGASNGKDDELKRFFYARYDGILRVADAEHLHDSVIQGIGSAKGFGFGLLSLARIKE